MIQVEALSPVMVLEERLRRGADFLFSMEQRGDTGQQYAVWLQHWLELLGQYEALQAA